MENIINYYNLLSKTNQLIDILDNKYISNEYLLFIYYTCCMVGGYESYDYLVHLLVYKISKSIIIDLSLYYPIKVDIKNRMIETKPLYDQFYNINQKKLVISFINNIKNNNIINIINNNLELEELFNNSLSLRGYQQKINYNKIYCGNKRVNDYFINNIDIEIMNKLMSKNIIKKLKIYFQVPQLMHPYKKYRENKYCLLIINNYCIDNYKKNHNLCEKFNGNYNTNLITSLINYGDCREQALILEFYRCIKEWNKYIKLLKNFNEKKIIKLIKNHNRLIDTNIYISGYTTKKYKDFPTIKDFINITNKYDIIYNNIKYVYYENHNFILKLKYKKNHIYYKTYDIMYNKYDLSLKDTYFCGDYIVDNKEIKLEYPYIDLGLNDYNNNFNVIGEITKTMFKNIRFVDNLENKLLYLSKELKLPNNFYNINNFIITREKLFNKLRKKYMYDKNEIKHYDGNNSKLLKYFLLEDI